MREYTTELEMNRDFHPAEWWTDDAAARQKAITGTGAEQISIITNLAMNPAGFSLENLVWWAGRHEFLGDDLFDLLEECVSRIGGVFDSRSKDAMSLVVASKDGTRPTREVLKTSREDAEAVLPTGFNPTTRGKNNTLEYASFMAIMSLEELERGRTHRSAHYAMTVVRIMAGRTGVADPNTEYQWVIDRILSYYQAAGLNN